MWRRRPQADPGRRSPTEKRPSSTDKDIPHLSFSSSSTLQGQLCVFHLHLLQKAHTLRLCFCILCLFVVVVVVVLTFLKFYNCSKVSVGVEGKFPGLKWQLFGINSCTVLHWNMKLHHKRNAFTSWGARFYLETTEAALNGRGRLRLHILSKTSQISSRCCF